LSLAGQGSVYPASSRYHATPVVTSTLPDGRIVRHLARRLVPAPESLATLSEIRVIEGDRPDLLAARYLGDSTQWWRLCDANRFMEAGALVAEVGRYVRIPLPEGVPYGGAGQ